MRKGKVIGGRDRLAYTDALLEERDLQCNLKMGRGIPLEVPAYLHTYY